MKRYVGYPVVLVLLICWFASSKTDAQAVKETNEAAQQDAVAEVVRPLRELLKARRDTLEKYLEVMQKRYEDGTQNFIPVIKARDTLLLAELELCDSKRERLAIYKKRVENLRNLEQSATIMVESGHAKTEENSSRGR